MPSINKCFALFFLALSVSALTTPHAIRNVNHHRAVAAALDSERAPVPRGFIRRRSIGGRCVTKPATTTAAAASSPVANLEGAPPTTTTSDSSSLKPTPTPSSTKHATSTAGTSGGGNQPSFMKGMNHGELTFYAPGLGACGITNSGGDHITAVSHLLFDNYPGYDGVNPNTNPICGKKIMVSYQGKSVAVTVTDRCVGCKLLDLDLSPTAFSALADQSLGRLRDSSWSLV